MGKSSHSTGKVPSPGIGSAPGGWNIPRIRVVALIGNGTRSAFAADGRGVSLAVSRTKKPRCRRASTRPCACN